MTLYFFLSGTIYLELLPHSNINISSYMASDFNYTFLEKHRFMTLELKINCLLGSHTATDLRYSHVQTISGVQLPRNTDMKASEPRVNSSNLCNCRSSGPIRVFRSSLGGLPKHENRHLAVCECALEVYS